MMYPSQEPYPSQQPSGTEPYSSEAPYTPYAETGSDAYSAPGVGPYPYNQQPQSGPYQYPPQGPYAQQDPYAPQQPQGGPYQYPPQGAYPYGAQGPFIPQYGKISNTRANNGMIYGFISVALGLITLATNIGYAGLITGTFAIFYGFMGLNTSKRLPNNTGRAQAITAIVLGFAAWFVVIVSLIARSAFATPY